MPVSEPQTGSYFRPAEVEEALLALTGHEPPQLVSGGTDLYAAWADVSCAGQHLIDISAIASLRQIAPIADGWRLGAAVTWTELIHAPLPAWFDALKACARKVGGVQIQNRGTLGGNVCHASPAADGIVALLALDARVILQSLHGVREVGLAEFIVGPRKTARGKDELVVAFDIPQRSHLCRSHFAKLGQRRYLVISIAILAIVIDLDDKDRVSHAAVAVGALSARACRLHLLEQHLLGLARSSMSSISITPAMLDPLTPIDDVRASRAYRLEAIQIMLRRALAELAQ